MKSNRHRDASREQPAAPVAWVRRVRNLLLGHFDQHRRELPWRANADPYRVWVSEIMLQQTRVETVRPYYDRWLKRFPTVHVLAEAPLDDVLKAWEGLGYYSRARNLHTAARVICERHSGRLPDTATGLRELPGIGAYTAGAVASIAYARREPVIDGNVNRVLHRLLDAQRLRAKELRNLAAQLVPLQRPGDFNQALMELGATICTPRAPRCVECPLRLQCRSFANGTQLERPVAQPKRAIPEKRFEVIVLVDAQCKVMLRQRPERGLLAGLWEFPTRPDLDLDISGMRFEELGTVTHTFSHFRAQYHVRFAHTRELTPIAPCHAVAWSELERYTLPTAQRRVASLVSSALDREAAPAFASGST